MTPCPRCGGPQILLLTSWACKAECDLRVHVDKPLTNISLSSIREHLDKLTEAVRSALIVPIKFLGPAHEYDGIISPHALQTGMAPKTTVTKVELFRQLLPPGKRSSSVVRDVRPMPGTVHYWEIEALGGDFDERGNVFYYIQFQIHDRYRLTQRDEYQWIVFQAAV